MKERIKQHIIEGLEESMEQPPSWNELENYLLNGKPFLTGEEFVQSLYWNCEPKDIQNIANAIVHSLKPDSHDDDDWLSDGDLENMIEAVKEI
jgi:hypothetical protein